jgi:hypothetical protein
MSDDLVMFSLRAISRVAGCVVLTMAAFLFLTQAGGFSTDCLGHDISISRDGLPTGGEPDGRAAPVRHGSGEVVDASHNFLEFDRASEASGESGGLNENAPTHEGSARAEGLMRSIVNWLATNFDLPASRESVEKPQAFLTSDARKALAPEREKAVKITRQFIAEGPAD